MRECSSSDVSGLEPEEQQQCEARLWGCICYWFCHEQLPAAIELFEETWNKPRGVNHPQFVLNPRHLITYNVAKLQQHFTLRTLKPKGPDHILPDAEAKRCAEILAAGYMQQRYAVDGLSCYTYYEHCYFTSMRDAVMHDSHLQQVLEDYSISLEHLLRRCHAVDPKLVYRHPSMKAVLPDRTKQRRVRYGSDMNFRLSASADLLLDVFWMDECTIWVGRDLAGKLKVWYHRGDLEGAPPMPNLLMVKGKSFKICLLLVLSARHGCVHAELLSGTTGLQPQDRVTPEMRAVMARRGNVPYKVCYHSMMQSDAW